MATKAEQLVAQLAEIGIQPFVTSTGARLFDVMSDGTLRVNMGNIRLPAADAIAAKQWLIDNFETQQPE